MMGSCNEFEVNTYCFNGSTNCYVNSVCKKEEAKNAEQAAEVESVQTSPEQQAAIDAIDKPILDEKNTDVEDAEVAASEAQ